MVFKDAQGQDGVSSEIPFSLEPLGAQSYTVTLNAPAIAGKYTLQAIAASEDDRNHPTISHRDVSVLPETIKAADVNGEAAFDPTFERRTTRAD
jgi:hypothetical protein